MTDRADIERVRVLASAVFDHVTELRTLAPRLADRLALALDVVEAAKDLDRLVQIQPSRVLVPQHNALHNALARFDGRE